MITREQMYTLLMLRKREGTLFSTLPMELLLEINDCGQEPDSDIAKALHHAAYARQEDVITLLDMLEINPRLLLQAGNVKTPGGDEIKRVTLYEFLLGAGDYELAKIVQSYFSKIEHGEQDRIRQYERYRPHIESMLTQEPYDLIPLIERIKKASSEEITALLNKDMTSENDLCKAIIQFREDWAPRTLLKPSMHYNYVSLQHAFNLLTEEWENLYKASGNNFNKIDLVWRQLIGFEMRRLPGIDRCVIAQKYPENTESFYRSYSFKHGEDSVLPIPDVSEFPITDIDDSIDGLGGDFAVDIWGPQATPAAYTPEQAIYSYAPDLAVTLKKQMANKHLNLIELIQPLPEQAERRQNWCVLI